MTTNSRYHQLWKRRDAYIENINTQTVLEVQEGIDTQGRNIWVNNKNGAIQQLWDVIYVDEWKDDPKKGELNEDFGLYVDRTFHVVSQLSSNRYLDLINNRNMVIKTSNTRKTQEWWFDQNTLTIKSRINNQSWDIKNSGKTNVMQVWSTNSRWW
jgi:membrane carboxypeptidase/penicillin-binding protein PbpC